LNLELRIGAIVVDGVPAAGAGLGDAVERELRRLAGERGLPPGLRTGATTPLLDAGSIPAHGDRLGEDLARAIWEALE
jgi:hypothetical protein